MRTQREKATDESIQQQLIQTEKLYQSALLEDEQFSVLKGFKEIMKKLKLRLQVNSNGNTNIT